MTINELKQKLKKICSLRTIIYAVLTWDWRRHKETWHRLEGCLWCYIQPTLQERFWDDLAKSKEEKE